MQGFRALAKQLRPLVFPDSDPRPTGKDQSPLARLATPHTFSPTLNFRNALVAIAGSLARIFSFCILFAGWGGASAWAWSSIENRFWAGAAVLSLFLLFLAALAGLMIAVSVVERTIAPRRSPEPGGGGG